MEVIIFFIVLALLLIPFKIETQIMLNAPQKDVMKLLTKFEDFEVWNPFIIFVSGTFRLNSVLKVKLNIDNKTLYLSPKIIAIKDDMFCWRGVLGMRFIFDGIHCFKTESMPKDRTLFTHTEHFQGILVWLMLPMLVKTKKRFELMNEALKEEIELHKKG